MSETLTTNSTISHYRIIRKIGAGGMGEVYLAEDTKLHRKVALKLLPAEFSRDNQSLRRFVREARAASALNHANICTIYEINDECNPPFMAMEYVEGETLDQTIKSRKLDLRQTLDIALQISDALAEAHAHNIIHRDIKPQNIIVNRRGQAKILDFGLAKKIATESEEETQQLLSQAGMILGTARFMSPEQARGKETDARTDIFSLGVVLYEMATRKPPFAGETTSDVIAAILKNEPMPPSDSNREIPAEFERIILKALAKDREERYQTAKDLLVDLRRLKKQIDVQTEIERTKQPRKITDAEGENATQILEPLPISSSAGYAASEIKKHKIAFIVTLVILSLTIVGFGYWYFNKHSTTTTQIESIAVLPFENASGDANLDYLSDGIAESLMNSLSQMSNLKVMSRNSVFRYKGKEQNAQKVGSELNVRAVLTGSVKQIGDQLVINVSLDDAQDNHRIWGEQYNRKSADILAVQRDIAQEVSSNLRLRLTSAEQQQLAKRSTDNVEAYRLYLRGNYYLYSFTPDGLQKALKSYNEAVELDPTYALAYAGLANAYGISASFGNDEAAMRAEAAALKAIELDPTLADTYAALGSLRFWQKREVDKAQDSFNRALELNPNSAVIHHYYSWFLIATARFDEAERHLRRALELDPLSPGINADQGLPLFFSRRYDEARVRYEQALKSDANFGYAHLRLAEACEGAGDFACAVGEFERAIVLLNDNSTTRAQLARTLALAGKKDEARRLLDELTAKDKAPTMHASPYFLALAYAALGETDKAFDILNRALAENDKWLGWAMVDPRNDPLRDDSRFQELLRKISFPQ